MSWLKKIKYQILTKGFGLYINSLHYVNAKFAAETAYTLFSSPREGLLKTIPTFLTSSETRKIRYLNHTIQTYKWQGNKETILLIHGWESNANRWKGVIETLKDHGYTIIALDAPGQGLSSGKELNAVLYAEFINEVSNEFKPDYFIGHSLGGMTMFYYLSRFQPKHLKKVLSLGAPNRFLRITDNYRDLVAMSKKSYKEFLNEFPKRFNVNPAEFNTEVFINNIDTNIPIGIIHDDLDKVVPYNDALQIIEKHPRIKLLTTHNLGHSLYDPLVNEQIIYFLENNLFKS